MPNNVHRVSEHVGKNVPSGKRSFSKMEILRDFLLLGVQGTGEM